jgi:FkbM family methyltransferase
MPRTFKLEVLRQLLQSLPLAKVPAAMLTAFAARLRNECPPEVVLTLKNSLDITLPLDHPSANIMLVMGASSELPRRFASQKEPWTVAWITRVLGDEDVFYDIGANVGAYALIAARHRRSARIVAFEPSFENYAALCRNVAHNRCESQVVPLPLAIGHATGLETFNYYALGPGKALHTLGDSVDYRGQRFQPEFCQRLISVSLDDAIALLRLPAPNHIKIDVDGTEMDVLRGGEQLLRGPNVKSILVEICEQRIPSRQIIDFLAERGLRLAARYDRPNPAGQVHDVAYLLFERP